VPTPGSAYPPRAWASGREGRRSGHVIWADGKAWMMMRQPLGQAHWDREASQMHTCRSLPNYHLCILVELDNPSKLKRFLAVHTCHASSFLWNSKQQHQVQARLRTTFQMPLSRHDIWSRLAGGRQRHL
jgi:hypothetical protein